MKYSLTYRYTNATVEAVITRDDIEAYKIDLCRMIKLSIGRPWKLEEFEYKTVDVVCDKNIITVFIENEFWTVLVTASLSNDGNLFFEVEWKNVSEQIFNDVMLGVGVTVQTSYIDNITIPSICYNCRIDDSGEYKNERLAGGGFVTEEHGLSMPAVWVETRNKSNKMGLFSIPSECGLNDKFDNEWSIGIVKDADDTGMVLLSGVLMASGQKDCIWGSDDVLVHYERGYFDMPGGASVVKKFVICDISSQRTENEFSKIIMNAHEFYNLNNGIKNNHDEFMKYKSVALKNRFIESDCYVGYGKMLSSKKSDDQINQEKEDDESSMHYTDINNVWTVENIAAAWCDLVYSVRQGKKDGILRAKKCVDFYIGSSKAKRKGIRYLCYDNSEMKWKFSMKEGNIPSYDLGLMAYYIADMIYFMKMHFLDISDEWLQALEDVCDFLISKRKITKLGIYPKNWAEDGGIYDNSVSAESVTCVCALIRGYQVTKEKKYILCAARLLPKYYDYMLVHHKPVIKKNKTEYMSEIDDNDKIALTYFVIAAENYYEVTHDEKILKMASAAIEKLITYIDMVNYKLRKESKLSKIGIDTRGLVYSDMKKRQLNTIFPTAAIRMIEKGTGKYIFKDYVDSVISASTQIVSTYDGEYGFMAVGEQPDVIYVTNWPCDDKEKWRGGYGDFNDLREFTWAFRQMLKHLESEHDMGQDQPLKGSVV